MKKAHHTFLETVSTSSFCFFCPAHVPKRREISFTITKTDKSSKTSHLRRWNTKTFGTFCSINDFKNGQNGSSFTHTTVTQTHVYTKAHTDIQSK